MVQSAEQRNWEEGSAEGKCRWTLMGGAEGWDQHQRCSRAWKGKLGWAEFRSVCCAAKCLYRQIVSNYVQSSSIHLWNEHGIPCPPRNPPAVYWSNSMEGAKVSDYSVRLHRRLRTAAPANPSYAAPEAVNTAFQSPEMEIFSL